MRRKKIGMVINYFVLTAGACLVSGDRRRENNARFRFGPGRPLTGTGLLLLAEKSMHARETRESTHLALFCSVRQANVNE